jgi:hypothetical protein
MTMPECAFTDKAKQPTAKQLSSALGDCAKVWDDYCGYLRERLSPLDEEWKFGKTGWMLVPKRKKRTVCYLFPAAGYFTVAFVLGEKAVEVARESKLPKKILESIEAAHPYAEGRGFYVDVKKTGDLVHLKTLVGIKFDMK